MPILTSCPLDHLGWAVLQGTSVFKQVVSLYNGTDGFVFHFRKMVINQAGGASIFLLVMLTFSLGWPVKVFCAHLV